MHLAEFYFGCIVLIGFACLALMLLAIRLQDVDEQISYLKVIAVEWFPPELVLDAADAGPSSAGGSGGASGSGGGGGNMTLASYNNYRTITHYIDNFRSEIDNLIVELWSIRTTLILSLIFVVVYILSWGWMAYTIREAETRVSQLLAQISDYKSAAASQVTLSPAALGTGVGVGVVTRGGVESATDTPASTLVHSANGGCRSSSLLMCPSPSLTSTPMPNLRGHRHNHQLSSPRHSHSHSHSHSQCTHHSHNGSEHQCGSAATHLNNCNLSPRVSRNESNCCRHELEHGHGSSHVSRRDSSRVSRSTTLSDDNNCARTYRKYRY